MRTPLYIDFHLFILFYCKCLYIYTYSRLLLIQPKHFNKSILKWLKIFINPFTLTLLNAPPPLTLLNYSPHPLALHDCLHPVTLIINHNANNFKFLGVQLMRVYLHTFTLYAVHEVGSLIANALKQDSLVSRFQVSQIIDYR